MERFNNQLYLQSTKEILSHEYKNTLGKLLNILKKSSMNKQELINAMAEESGLSKADSKKALDGFIKAVTSALKAQDKISLIGFGSFSVAEKAERQGINPSTKQPITIPAKKVVKFKAGAELAEEVK